MLGMLGILGMFTIPEDWPTLGKEPGVRRFPPMLGSGPNAGSEDGVDTVGKADVEPGTRFRVGSAETAEEINDETGI